MAESTESVLICQISTLESVTEMNNALKRSHEKGHNMPRKGLIDQVGTKTTDDKKKEFATSGIEGTKGTDKEKENTHE